MYAGVPQWIEEDSMRVIITGGTGLIGRALTEELVSAGYEVVILSRDPDRARGFPERVRLVAWDGRTAQGWSEWVEGSRAIVNLAGAGLADRLWTSSRKRVLAESRLLAGKAVVEAVERAERKPEVVIQASAIGYYGPHGQEPLSEGEAAGSDFLAELCRQWEESSRPVETLGVRRAVVRTGLVLSRSGGVLPRLLLPIKLFVGGPMGSGRQYYSWIHIRDEVKAIRFLIEDSSAQGAYNLTAPEPLPNAEFVQVVGRAIGRPSWLPLPEFALRLLVGDMATVLVDGQRALPNKLSDEGFSFEFTTLKAAMQDLSR